MKRGSALDDLCSHVISNAIHQSGNFVEIQVTNLIIGKGKNTVDVYADTWFSSYAEYVYLSAALFTMKPVFNQLLVKSRKRVYEKKKALVS